METLKIKKLTDTAIIPTRAKPGDAGLDLYIDETVEIGGMGNRELVSTGIAMAIPTGYFGLIRPRSGLAMDGVSTDAGVVDSGYRGEVKVLLTNSRRGTVIISQGERIAQIIIIPCAAFPVMEVDALDETERGSAGFGSTGA
jgi:dUTP pyrophosphatase